jgi:peptide-methionine (S)-S-oxide reductase
MQPWIPHRCAGRFLYIRKASNVGSYMRWVGGNELFPTRNSFGYHFYAKHLALVCAARVTYDPAKVTYSQLVEYFWKTIDPTEKDKQFCDEGSQYRSGIYWGNEAERQTATASRDALLKTGRFKMIHTELAAASTFYLAEEYHQDYYKKNPVRYSYYRNGCGRDAQLKRVWN